MKKTILLAILSVTIGKLIAQTTNSANWTSANAYFGQTPPTEIPQVFAPKMPVDSGIVMGSVAFSTDGTAFYYGYAQSWTSRVNSGITKRAVDGQRWSQPIPIAEALNNPTLSSDASVNAQQAAPEIPDMKDSLAVTTWLKSKGVPCLAIGYLEEGKRAEIKVFGELKQGVPAPINTLFNVASVTKTITAMVTLSLANAGSWEIDAPIAAYFIDPDVAQDPRSKHLTTRHILTHQTGFPNWRTELSGGKLAFQFEPGTHYQYSGEGFEYLRHALESKFRRSLYQLADSIVFKPLGMNSTSFTWNPGDENRLAFPFDESGMPLAVVKNTESNAADLLKTTASDYCKFMAWLLSGAGLRQELFEEMASHQVERKANSYMGLGWVIYEPVGGDQYALSHGGHDPGVHTIVLLLPKAKQALLIFTNSDKGIQLYPELLRYYLGVAGQDIVTIETGRKN
ncbi:serine hydrolase domain-containing protein [Spirosoma radiotolerans]|uniref:serine hydrolase domain-containing protein n=1 Tax=Spirosoma radiotolerans TaxID=1379870 RepID=UPI000696393F|nr:serine hydrolase domain-containing protein [Spirosoma radiotolerans]